MFGVAADDMWANDGGTGLEGKDIPDEGLRFTIVDYHIGNLDDSIVLRCWEDTWEENRGKVKEGKQ